MSDDLSGKVVVVTGGANGLGRGMVELFVAQGARVVIADRDRDAGASLARLYGAQAHFQAVDVSDAQQLQNCVDSAVATFGTLDVMVNNAAVSSAFHPRLLDETFDEFEQVMRINVLAVLRGTQYAARHMRDTGGGSIINVAATSGLTAGFGVAAYRIAKAGVVHFTRSAAIDLAEYGIRVNAIAPGNIATDMNAFTPPGVDVAQANRWRARLDAVRMANQPMKRKGTARDVAEAVRFLASDAAAQITGVVLPVDGGITAGDPINHLQAILAARAELDGDWTESDNPEE